MNFDTNFQLTIDPTSATINRDFFLDFPYHLNNDPFNKPNPWSTTLSNHQIHPDLSAIQHPSLDSCFENGLNDLVEPSLTTSNPTANSIDCWIDFSGGDNTRPSCITTSLLSPTGSTEPSSLPSSLIVDQQQPWISHLPPPPLPLPPLAAAQNHPLAHEPAQNRASFKRKCTQKPEPTSPSSASHSSSPPACSSSPSPSTCTSSSQPQTATTKKTKNNNKKKTAPPPQSSRNRKKADARNEFLERNRLAASRSRAKKKSYQQFLEDQARRLEEEQLKLKQIILQLVAEKEHLKSLVDQNNSNPL